VGQTLKRRVIERLVRWEGRFHAPVRLALERRRPAAGAPVFILAAPHSGAEEVSAILARHPRFACAHETSFMVGLLATLREKNCVTGYRTIGVTHDAAVANIRVLALNYYERFLHVSGRARWVDSTASHAPFASELEEVFAPDVRFVHVTRHGVDVAHAIANAGGVANAWGHWVDYFHQEEQADTSPAQRLQAAANLWQAYNRVLHEFAGRRPNACHVIRSDDLRDNPEPAVRALLDFLGESWMPGLLDEVRRDERRALANGDAPIDDRAIREQLAPDLERYGYDARRP
jgi:hypothetical protein